MNCRILFLGFYTVLRSSIVNVHTAIILLHSSLSNNRILIRVATNVEHIGLVATVTVLCLICNIEVSVSFSHQQPIQWVSLESIVSSMRQLRIVMRTISYKNYNHMKLIQSKNFAIGCNRQENQNFFIFIWKKCCCLFSRITSTQ